MALTQDDRDPVDEAQVLVTRIEELFRGQEMAVIGVALCELLANWVTSHVTDHGPQHDVRLQRRLLQLHFAGVLQLIDLSRERKN